MFPGKMLLPCLWNGFFVLLRHRVALMCALLVRIFFILFNIFDRELFLVFFLDCSR